jgi:hypothetical protein
MSLFVIIVNFIKACSRTVGMLYDLPECAIIQSRLAENPAFWPKSVGGRQMTTRLKIDLSQGLLEVEGSETFVKAIYNDFKAHFVESDGQLEETPLTAKPRRVKTVRSAKTRTETVPLPIQPSADETKLASAAPVAEVVAPPIAEPVIIPPPPEPIPEPKAPAPILPTYTYMEDLKLSAAGGRPALVEFMDSKLPITNEERNLVVQQRSIDG